MTTKYLGEPIQNECCACKHVWTDKPGGWAEVKVMVGWDSDGHEKWEARCPKCWSKYFRWIRKGAKLR